MDYSDKEDWSVAKDGPVFDSILDAETGENPNKLPEAPQCAWAKRPAKGNLKEVYFQLRCFNGKWKILDRGGKVRFQREFDAAKQWRKLQSREKASEAA